MVRAGWLVVLSMLAAAAGCTSQEKPSALVSPNPFDSSVPLSPGMRASYAPAATEEAARVDLLGRKLIAANPEIGMKPIFFTIGAPQPEIFHKGARELDITEGLVKQCPDDAQLAAVLCHELGKMVSEREALTGPKVRNPERLPPIDVPVGNDPFGNSPDMVALAERAKYAPRPQYASSETSLPPDPNTLARFYLKKAHYAESDLDNVQPLLALAAQNSALEKQLAGPPAGQPWAP